MAVFPQSTNNCSTVARGRGKAYRLWKEENHDIPVNEVESSPCCDLKLEGAAALKAVIRRIRLVAFVGEHAARVPWENRPVSLGKAVSG